MKKSVPAALFLALACAFAGTPTALRADPPASAPVFAPANQLNPGKPLPFTLRQVFHRLEHDRTEQFPFTEVRTFAISKNPLRQTGTLRTGKEYGLSLSYEGTAKPHIIIVDDKGLIDRQPGGGERQVTIADHPELAALTDLYLNLLRGNAAKLFDYADVYFTGTAQAWELGLVPHDAAVAKRAGKVVINGGGHYVTRLENLLPNGEKRTLELGKVERNPKFAPEVVQAFFRGQS